jgi:hypothetical protein
MKWESGTQAVAAAIIVIMSSASPALAMFFVAYPMSTYWEWGEQLPKGQVRMIETTTQSPWAADRPPAVTTFHKGKNGGVEMRQFGATVEFDASGRRTRVISPNRPAPGEPAGKIKTESVIYDAQGDFASIEQQIDDQPPTKYAVTKTVLPGGAKTLSWQHKFGPTTFVAELTLDAQGRIVRWFDNPPGKAGNPPYVFEYNPQGDIANVTMGAHSQNRYEYEYDTQGNWTRRTSISIRRGQPDQQATYLRRIEYGEPTTAPASPLIAAPGRVVTPARPTKPAGGNQPMPDAPPPAPQAGAEIYRVERGERGSGVFNQMTLVLNPDKSANLTNYTEFREQKFTKATLGSWVMDGEKIVATMSKFVDGSPLPENLVMRLSRDSDGNLTPEHDPKTSFKRVAEGK